MLLSLASDSLTSDPPSWVKTLALAIELVSLSWVWVPWVPSVLLNWLSKLTKSLPVVDSSPCELSSSAKACAAIALPSGDNVS